MTAVVVLSALSLVLLSSLVTWIVSDSTVGPVMRTRVKRKVVVTLKSGAAFRGVLMQADRHALVLHGTETLGNDGTHLPVDGELVVLRPDVEYIQVP